MKHVVFLKSLATSTVLAALASGGCSSAARDDHASDMALRTAETSVETGRRNVLLVILDDVGAEEIRSYAGDLLAAPRAAVATSVGIVDTNGNGTPDGLEDLDGDGQPDGAIATPRIDSLASAGVRFTQVSANPVCSPTRAGIYTGLYGRNHGIGAPVGVTMIDSLPTDIATLAEVIRTRGAAYKTGFFGKWHLGDADTMIPTARGWDYFAGAVGGEIDYSSWTKTTATYGGVPSTALETGYATEVNVTDALAWIRQQRGAWWATVAMNAAHSQLTSPDYPQPPAASCPASRIKDTGNPSLDNYHRTLECADHYIGVLIDGIPAAVLANTTVVFVGDNGDEDAVSQVYTTEHSKNTVYQGGVHVPLIIADGAALVGRASAQGPGRVAAPGRTVSSIVNTVDIFATAAAVMGVTPTASTDSVSLTGYLSSPNAAAARVYSYTDAFMYAGQRIPASPTSAQVAALIPTDVRGAVRTSRYKLVYDGDSQRYALYDLSTDSLEQVDLACTPGTTGVSNLLTAELQRIDTNYPALRCPQ